MSGVTRSRTSWAHADGVRAGAHGERLVGRVEHDQPGAGGERRVDVVGALGVAVDHEVGPAEAAAEGRRDLARAGRVGAEALVAEQPSSAGTAAP